ncbi:hypothetical protein C8Q80DRAFT_1117547 [Daedaleopsis nitida]|nr:hypothetical protein C8Q80DRAFT_1117547 [Daedaleopsis nitida]
MTPDGPPLHDALTSGLIALCFGFMLYGVILCQVLQYFREYKDDPLLFKAVVMTVLVGETAHTILGLYVGYYYLIQNFGNGELIGTWCLALSVLSPLCLIQTFVYCKLTPHSSQLEPIIMALTIVSCQYIFLHRLYFYRSNTTVVQTVVYRFHISLAIALAVEQILDVTYDHWLKYKWLVSASFAITSGGDIFIAAMLVTTLHKSRTGIKRTDTLLDMLIIYALSSAVTSSILSTTCLLVTLLEGNNFTIIPVSVVATKSEVVCFDIRGWWS